MQERTRAEIDHRRRQHGPLDDVGMVMQIAQRAMAAHRMGQKEERLRRVRLDDGLDEEMHVVEIIVEAPDKAFLAIRQGAGREALAAPIEGVDGEAPVQEVDDRLDMLLDELAPACEQDDRAARLAGIRVGP